MNRQELLQNAKPILFNTAMVKAILEGKKSCTRRVIKYSNNANPNETLDDFAKTDNDWECIKGCCQYQVGDILWVRETWSEGHDKGTYIYKADDKLADLPNFRASTKLIYRPSIHMPKDAARIFLKVTDVKVERLQDIITSDYKTPINIKAEGIYIPCLNCTHYNGECKDFIADETCNLVEKFKNLWNGTIKKQDIDRYGWKANPWVWVIEFERATATNADSLDNVLRELAAENERRHALGLDSLSYGKYTRMREKEQSDT